MNCKGEWEAVKNATGEWIILADDIAIAKVDRHFNAHLIVAAVNACKEVNPGNPQAAAESIGRMYEALEALKTQFMLAVDDVRSKDREVYEMAEKALAKAEDKVAPSPR